MDLNTKIMLLKLIEENAKELNDAAEDMYQYCFKKIAHFHSSTTNSNDNENNLKQLLPHILFDMFFTCFLDGYIDGYENCSPEFKKQIKKNICDCLLKDEPILQALLQTVENNKEELMELVRREKN